MDYKEITLLFNGLISSIDYMLENAIYKEKETIAQIKEKVQIQFNDFKLNKTLINITVEDIKFLDLEITDLFDKYIAVEDSLENYIERISYNFGLLKKVWKDEKLK